MLDLFVGKIGETESGGVPQILEDGQLFDQQIVLRYEPDQLLAFLLLDGMPVDANGTLLGDQVAIQEAEQCGFTHATTTHDGH